jgi:hypothetical protein
MPPLSLSVSSIGSRVVVSVAIAALVACARDQAHREVKNAAVGESAAARPTPPVSGMMDSAQDDAHRAGTRFRGTPRLPTEYLGDESFTSGNYRYSLFHVGFERRQELWLAEATPASKNDSVPEWMVIASFIPADTLNDDVRVRLGCGAAGAIDSTLAVVVGYEDLPTLTNVIHAWRANPVTRRFDSVATTGITCPNPGL